MPASITNVEQVATNAWRYTFTGADEYHGTIRGESVFSNREEDEYIAENVVLDGDTPSSTPPVLELLDQDDYDAGTRAATYEYPQFAWLQWRGDLTADNYVVEYYRDGVWVTYRTVPETREGYYRMRTPFLEDNTTQQWRVTPYDAHGNAGTATNIEWMHICTPEMPAHTITYDAGTGYVTVASA